MRMCSTCINDSRNPSITIHSDGQCHICSKYAWLGRHVVSSSDQAKRKMMEVIGNKKCMVGMSGGKDSTATALTAVQLGFQVQGFTFDLGYYPEHIFPRAKQCAEKMGITHETIDIRSHITPKIRSCYESTAWLYQETEIESSFALSLYQLNRKHYSAKDTAVMPFVRSCQICRKVVVPAYYAEAKKRGVEVVILGMNEWAHLESDAQNSGIRVLQPNKWESPVYVAHLPYILGWKSGDTRNILNEFGWEVPPGENFIETNSNSCLFAYAAEKRATEMLGFHPDTTRLAREVSSGFITRQQGLDAISHVKEYDRTVSQVLQDAGIID